MLSAEGDFREKGRSSSPDPSLVPRVRTSTRAYESLAVNRSDVMQESINRNPFFFSLSLSSSRARFLPSPLPPSLALSAISLRAERICRFFLLFLASYTCQRSSHGAMRRCVPRVVRYLSKEVLIPFVDPRSPRHVSNIPPL